MTTVEARYRDYLGQTLKRFDAQHDSATGHLSSSQGRPATAISTSCVRKASYADD